MADSSPQHSLTRSGRGWYKKVKGKTRWVCSVNEAPTGVEADAVYERRMTELHVEPDAPPLPAPATITVQHLCNLFLDRKRRAGIADRSVEDYADALDDFSAAVGDDRAVASLAPGDFAKPRKAWAGRFGPDRLSKFVTAVRSAFKWARKPPLRLPEPDWGDEFETPRRRHFRIARKARREAAGGPLTFDAGEVATLLAGATRSMRAMILLALNCGFGNTDIAALPRSAVDLRTGWIAYARGKTGIDRRAPLWPETIKALRAVLAYKPASRRHPEAWENPSLVFLTRAGRPYVEELRSRKGGGLLHKDWVGTQFNVLCRACGLSRPGRGFYALRKTFRTLADETGDQRAIALVMGRELTDIDVVYVEHIDDSRLAAVVNHVRGRIVGGAALPGNRGRRAGAARPAAVASRGRPARRG